MRRVARLRIGPDQPAPGLPELAAAGAHRANILMSSQSGNAPFQDRPKLTPRHRQSIAQRPAAVTRNITLGPRNGLRGAGPARHSRAISAAASVCIPHSTCTKIGGQIVSLEPDAPYLQWIAHILEETTQSRTPHSAFRTPHSALSRFVAQGGQGWRRTEGAGPGQSNLLALLPLLPAPPALQVLHCQT